MKKKNYNILVVAAHPDDEALGCGGTLAKHTSNGDIVKVVFLSDGETSRNETKNNSINLRKKNAIKSLKIIGVKKENIIFNTLPDNALDSIPLIKITKTLEDIKILFRPDVVYTHFGNDLNVDHRAAYNATLIAFRPQPKESVTKIFCFEVLSSTDWSSNSSFPFNPNYFVNIEKFYKKKIASIKAYKTEIKKEPHSRSLKNIENLAGFRGMSCGVKYAEAFFVERIID